ncbi:hypothetical protein ACVWZM_001264 [Bradyrhizobium sp. USDA 4501]
MTDEWHQTLSAVPAFARGDTGYVAPLFTPSPPRNGFGARHFATTSGTLPAGGVLRLRWVRTMPSMMVMPMPGRSPS